MQRIWIIALDIVLFLLLVSCMSMREEIVVHRDLSGTYTFEVTWDLKAMSNGPLQHGLEEMYTGLAATLADSTADLPKWVRFERQKSKDKDIWRFSFEFADLDNLKHKVEEMGFSPAAGAPGVCNLQWEKRRWTIACWGKVKLSSSDPTFGGDTPWPMLDSVTLRITMPGRIRESNAHKVSGRTVEWTWKQPFKQRMDVRVVCWLLPPGVLAAIGGLAAVGIAVTVSLVRSRGRRRATPSAREDPGSLPRAD